MQVITTVTQKGQVTIPKAIRNMVGIGAYSRVKVMSDKNRVIVIPQKSLLSMVPLMEAPKGKNAIKAREYMEKHYKRA